MFWVTGASGFLGQSLCRALQVRHSPVVAFGKSHNRLPDTRYFECDSLSFETFSKAIVEHGPPTLVYHMVGGATVGKSILSPTQDFESNVVTAQVLLEAIRRLAPAARVVFASSAAVYGKNNFDRIPVSAPCNPTSPYGFHKLMLESLAQSYAQNFGLSINVVRLFSIFGNGLRKQLLWDLCQKLKCGDRKIALQGTGHERRDWCHVSFVVDYLLSLENSSSVELEISNCSTGVAKTVIEIANAVAQSWGQNVTYEFSGLRKAGDPESLVGIPSGTLRPKLSVEEYIGDYVCWSKSLE